MALGGASLRVYTHAYTHTVRPPACRYDGYGELQRFGGAAPSQDRIRNEGKGYLEANFPLMDYITHCEVTD